MLWSATNAQIWGTEYSTNEGFAPILGICADQWHDQLTFQIGRKSDPVTRGQEEEDGTQVWELLGLQEQGKRIHMQQVQVLYLVKEFLVLCGWFSVAFTGSVLTRPSMEAPTGRLLLMLLMLLMTYLADWDKPVWRNSALGFVKKQMWRGEGSRLFVRGSTMEVQPTWGQRWLPGVAWKWGTERRYLRGKTRWGKR